MIPFINGISADFRIRINSSLWGQLEADLGFASREKKVPISPVCWTQINGALMLCCGWNSLADDGQALRCYLAAFCSHQSREDWHTKTRNWCRPSFTPPTGAIKWSFPIQKSKCKRTFRFGKYRKAALTSLTGRCGKGSGRFGNGLSIVNSVLMAFHRQFRYSASSEGATTLWTLSFLSLSDFLAVIGTI